mmetsp:Transcript_37416/g.72096  ORF Transcript_37416/g.72096 Transcript_37416/m.72096 type:complete len:138 (-) Transcript_37416:236-649(-)
MDAKKPASLIRGVHHIGLTVNDMDATLKFFIEVLGYSLKSHVPADPSYAVSNGKSMITLWHANENARPFHRKKIVGLHHLALRVSSEAALNQLYDVISKYPGAKIEFGIEIMLLGPGKHFMFYEPSGNRMEMVYWPM